MKDIVWSATLSVEVREIDDDHQKLVDLFNMLNHAVTGSESADYIEAILEELISCTAWAVPTATRPRVRMRNS